ncbi:MAG TPA: hypothetical protein VJT83_08805, partial [Chitinophagaceae bacterium]|nr:hypothetical protein [Chitinophagaceae bacterium]
MKKFIIGIILGTIIIAGLSFFLIPAVLTIDESTIIKASPPATLRVLQNDDYWKKWWPDNHQEQLTYGKTLFSVREKLYNQFKIDVVHKSDSINSVLNIIPLNYDSVQLEWIAVLKTSTNPFTRIRQYFSHSERKKEIKSILAAMNSYMGDQKNIYGVDFRREVVSDTLMVSIRKEFTTYPTVLQVDSMIQILRNYVAAQNAKLVDSPMLHVDVLAKDRYSAQVALPTDKALKNSGQIEFRRMVQGYMLIADVKGGQATVLKAISEIENMLHDYMRTSPAIPFELMLTDRAKEPDTTKWMTRIY